AQWVQSMGGRSGARPAPEPTTGAATVEGGAGRPLPRTPADTTGTGAGLAREPRDTLDVRDTVQGGVTAVPVSPPVTQPAQFALSPEAERGRQLFTSKVCIACHTIQG